MQSLFTTLTLLPLLLASAQQPQQPQTLLTPPTLTPTTFAPFLASHPLVLIDFYATWCTHCQSLTPEYAIAATALQILRAPIALARLNCDRGREEYGGQLALCEGLGVVGYPALKVFGDGFDEGDHVGEGGFYEGELRAEEIVRWVLGTTGWRGGEVERGVGVGEGGVEGLVGRVRRGEVRVVGGGE